MIDKLSNLHLLLRAPYFSKWPLELRFFSQSVHKSWTAYSERIDDQIRPDIPIILDLAQSAESEDEISSAQKPSKKRKIDLIGKGGVEGIDPTYAKFQAVLHKLQHRIDDKSGSLMCEICETPLQIDKDLFNICLDRDCSCMTHVSCLSSRFLQSMPPGTIVPKEGSCPSCSTKLQWADLMRLLSLRLRSEKEVKKLLKKRNRGAAAVAAELLEEDDSAEEEDEPPESGVENRHDSESELDDAASITSTLSAHSAAGSDGPSEVRHAADIEIVIDDSEDER